VKFDPEVISYKDLLDAYWEEFAYVEPAPPRTGNQYKPHIWYHDDEQRKLAQESIKEKKESGLYMDWQLKVPVEPVKPWHAAEEYHQRYLLKKNELKRSLMDPTI